MAHALNGAHPQARARSRAATVSIVSNTLLIALKIAAGVLTGSVAILTEALHSGIDLLASFIAFFSVRRAEEPADASHRYGHEKFENAAAAAEGMLILVGSGVIAYVEPGGEERLFEGRCEGTLAAEPHGAGGFGYDPIFVADETPGRTMAALADAEKDAISHRGHAARELSRWLGTR